MNNLCECGCGQRTNLWKYTDNRTNRKKGEPMRFVHGHGGQRDGTVKLDRIKKRYGLLVIIASAPSRSYGKQGRRHIRWKCKCDCGAICIVNASQFPRTRSCGCLRRAKGKHATGFKHGYSRRPEYRAYHSARDRCQNPKNGSYEDYGGRGIKFLYKSFEQFLKDVGDKPSKKHSLDRTDNDGHYKSGNCSWQLRTHQTKNQRIKQSIQKFTNAEIRNEYKRRGL